MNKFSEIAKALGIGSAPWVIRAYMTLLFVCALLMVVAMVADAAGVNTAASQVLSISIDSFKIVLGAVIGALSMAAHQQLGGSSNNADVGGAVGPRDKTASP